MAKQVVWTKTAQDQRRSILEFWAENNGNKTYSKKVSQQIRKRIRYIIRFNHIGRETTFQNIRVTSIGYFSIFYKTGTSQITIVSFWDNRQDDKTLKRLFNS